MLKLLKVMKLDEHQELMIQESLIRYLKDLYKDSKKVRTLEQIQAGKYNL